MRIDIVSIFPEYLDALDLSLVGKARRAGLVDIGVHDLRSWTRDRHRTVDDTPAGGGAGMVMRPDVWGDALDDVLDRTAPEGRHGSVPMADVQADGAAGPGDPAPDAPEAVLLVPTPSGQPFTQRLAGELAVAGRLVIACGRYEGIDARVAEHYANVPGIEVREVSIGDYVLGGGEVAALVIVEAVTRLLPGVLGNPESLDEESHGPSGLLEYPVYTRPVRWRGLDVPDVLGSGHHGKIARWRRDASLRRTARRRPDLLAALTPGQLDARDAQVLGEDGWFLVPVTPSGRGHPSATRSEEPTADATLSRVAIRRADASDAVELAALAARTFPLACPPDLAAEHIEEFVATELGAERFAAYLGENRRVILVAEHDSGLLGYTMTVLDSPPPGGHSSPGSAELSKCYVVAGMQGSGLAAALLTQTIGAVRAVGATSIWLGTNVANRRAQRFYRRQGFERIGRRRFEVGGQPQDDVVLARELDRSGPPVA